MTLRAQTLIRTLISHETPQVKSRTRARAPSSRTPSWSSRDPANLLLLSSIVCATLGVVLIALVDATQAVATLGAVGVLFYVGHWVVS